ncbi:MAG: peptide MFS transporter [Chitinophagaceae bacterium]|nr:peptide MFS transporter [Chitinophagaceae bacterium]MBP9102464.1 peptide MFS transporter [Chitinophagaceae bacterium]
MENLNQSTSHPRGLYVLFFTEMWERFGYYLMLGIFALYMLDSTQNGGMGFSASKKSDIYGTYLGLVYLTPFIGGLLADRILGYRKSIIIGALLMAAGYIGLAMPGTTTFYISLLLIIVGNGFFKPNISTLVGNLYNKPENQHKKDAGYNIFYMGINIGAFVCNFVAAYMRINYGWGYAFAAAGVGMLIGLVWFMAGMKHVKDVDIIKPTTKEDIPLKKILAVVFIPVIICGILGWFIPGNIFGSDSNDAFLIGCVPVVAYYISLWYRATPEDKNPLAALLTVMGCVVVFWAIFHQNGDALTVWAKDYTDRKIPTVVVGAADKVDLVQTVNYHESINYNKEEFETYLTGLKNQKDSLSAAGNKSAADAVAKTIAIRDNSREYFTNLPEDKRPAKGQDLKLISTELFQSINPFWVIVLTPLVVGIFGFLRRRGKEPSTPAKIAIGLLVTALSALVMVAAVKSINTSADKASAIWLWASYGVITIGELCLSPMGLSLVSKLSPPRLTSLMMGGWFLSTSIGNKLSGILSGLWEGYDDKSNFFLTNFFIVIVPAIALFLLLRWLNRVMKEKGVK